METIKLRSHIGTDGLLQIQIPAFKETLVEVVVVVQPLPNDDVASPKTNEPRDNAWGKPTTPKSIQSASVEMQQLRQEIAINKISLREMMEEERRF